MGYILLRAAELRKNLAFVHNMEPLKQHICKRNLLSNMNMCWSFHHISVCPNGVRFHPRKHRSWKKYKGFHWGKNSS